LYRGTSGLSQAKACYENYYAYATLVEDYERLVDEVGYAEVRVRGLHG